MKKDYVLFTKKYIENMDKKDMNDYERFLAKYYKEKYVSKTAEYKRMQSAKHTETVFAPKEKVFKFLVDFVVPKNEQSNLIEGEKISSSLNHTIYLRQYRKDEVFSYMFFSGKDKQYHTVTYRLKGEKTGFTVVTYMHEIKRETTIAGFNGMLGSIQFRNAHKNQAIKAMKYLNDKLGVKK